MLCEKRKTRQERPKSAPYLRLKNIKGTTIGNIRKKLKLQKMQGVPFDRIQKFSKTSCIVPKKQKWDPLVPRILLEA